MKRYIRSSSNTGDYDPSTAEAVEVLIGRPRAGKYRVTYNEGGRSGSQLFVVSDAEDLYEQMEAAGIGINDQPKGFTYIFDVTR